MLHAVVCYTWLMVIGGAWHAGKDHTAQAGVLGYAKDSVVCIMI